MPRTTHDTLSCTTYNSFRPIWWFSSLKPYRGSAIYIYMVFCLLKLPPPACPALLVCIDIYIYKNINTIPNQGNRYIYICLAHAMRLCGSFRPVLFCLTSCVDLREPVMVSRLRGLKVQTALIKGLLKFSPLGGNSHYSMQKAVVLVQSSCTLHGKNMHKWHQMA